MIYFLVFLLLMILTIRYDINGKTECRDQWYNAVLIILILIAGLRFRLGEDTIGYLRMFYHETPYLYEMDFDIFLDSGQPPLWLLLNSIIKTIGCRFFIVQFIQAALLNILLFKYFKKHSSYPFACITLYFIWRYFWFSMVVMKAAIALSIILFANDFFLEKKYVKGVLLVLIATGFHQTSILLLMIPFMLSLRFNILGTFVLVASFFTGVYLQRSLGDVFELFEAAGGLYNKVNGYLDSAFMTQSGNFNYFVVNVFPIIIYPILSIVYLKLNCKCTQILRLEPFLMIALLFQMMQFSIDIMYRYVYIFTPYYIIFIVHFFMELSKNTIKLEKSLAYARSFVIIIPFIVYCAYFYHTNYVGFYPYSSIIEKSTNNAREKYYSGLYETPNNYYLSVNEF